MKILKCVEIPGYNGRYLLYENGKVYSVKRTYKNHGKFTKIGGYYLNKVLLKIGYYTVALTKEGKTTIHYLHRLLGEAFLPNPCNYPQINHKDGNKLNNKLSNLEWCTCSYNIIHALNCGLRVSTRGSKIWSTKLNEKEVQNIREGRLNGRGVIEMAKEYSVDRSTIYSVLRRKNWKWVN